MWVGCAEPPLFKWHFVFAASRSRWRGWWELRLYLTLRSHLYSSQTDSGAVAESTPLCTALHRGAKVLGVTSRLASLRWRKHMRPGLRRWSDLWLLLPLRVLRWQQRPTWFVWPATILLSCFGFAKQNALGLLYLAIFSLSKLNTCVILLFFFCT